MTHRNDSISQKNGKINIIVNKNTEPSTFTRYLLEGSSFELLHPKRPDKEIIKYLKKRLLEKRVTVACLHCRKWKTTLSVNNFEDNPKCPQCGARYVGILRRREDLEIVHKGYKGKIDEEEKWKAAPKPSNWSVPRLCGKLGGRGICCPPHLAQSFSTNKQKNP